MVVVAFSCYVQYVAPTLVSNTKRSLVLDKTEVDNLYVGKQKDFFR